jgi:hypothetical protein
MPALNEFAWALEELRAGERVQRAGWNGKSMFVTLQPGHPTGVKINVDTAEAIGEPVGSLQRFMPHLLMRAADGSFVVWTPSTADLLAGDWRTYKKPGEVESQPAPAEAVTEEEAPNEALVEAGGEPEPVARDPEVKS